MLQSTATCSAEDSRLPARSSSPLRCSPSAASASRRPATKSSRRPPLRASVTVTSDLVRIGDIVDNAGTAAQIAIYRAPDLGTTGALPVAQVLNALRSHQVIGVDTQGPKEISVTRLARTLEGKDIEQQVARALERKNGLGDAANLNLTLRSRSRRCQARCLQHRRHAGDPRALRHPQQALRHHLLEIATKTAPPPTKLRLPAPPSRPSRPRCWRAMSSAARF